MGWWGGKQRCVAKGNRQAFISGCLLASESPWAEIQRPWTCTTAGHGSMVIVTVSLSLPVCRCQDIFQCIPGPLDHV